MFALVEPKQLKYPILCRCSSTKFEAMRAKLDFLQFLRYGSQQGILNSRKLGIRNKDIDLPNGFIGSLRSTYFSP